MIMQMWGDDTRRCAGLIPFGLRTADGAWAPHVCPFHAGAGAGGPG